MRSLVICKYRDSNMFGNHFHILNSRMVQSVESVWTVLDYVFLFLSNGVNTADFI